MTINEIKRAITELSPNELARFRQWFVEFDAKIFGKQIELYAESEKLAVLPPMTEEHLKKLQGSFKGKGVLKALMEERRKG